MLWHTMKTQWEQEGMKIKPFTRSCEQTLLVLYKRYKNNDGKIKFLHRFACYKWKVL